MSRRGDPGKKWLAFLQNHREVIVAFDCFTVPTLTFHLLYCFFVIEHCRRKILHFNVTRHPTAEWVVQQLRETFPDTGPYRYVILDRDSKFDQDVMAFLQATGLQPKQTSVQAPWQNGLAERWVGSCRREILDHVIALSEQHLRRIIRDYVKYHHEDRIHDSLNKDTPNQRPVEQRPSATASVIACRGWVACTIATLGAKQHSISPRFSRITGRASREVHRAQAAQVTKRGAALRAASWRVYGNLPDLVVCPRPGPCLLTTKSTVSNVAHVTEPFLATHNMNVRIGGRWMLPR